MKRALGFVGVVLLAGCATPPPSGPSVMVLPGSGKSFDQFRYDDYECRQYSSTQVGGSSAQQASVDSGLKSAAIGTAVGAAAGGLMGGNSGAGVGAGVGLAAGALAGTGAASESSYTLQQRYDIAYQQCMYAKGNQIPMAASRYTPRSGAIRQAVPPPPPPPSTGNPPPPAGNPPPPPPGVRPG
jgi:outer membrane lipoprotein SlyB